MLILGLLLIIAAAALAVGAVYDGGEDVSMDLLGYDLDTTVAGVFFAGMATTALLLLGVWLMQASMGRARRRRLERKQAKVRQHESVSRLEEERSALRVENERLAEKLQQERAAAGSTGDAAHGAHAATGTSAEPDLPPRTAGTSDSTASRADDSSTTTSESSDAKSSGLPQSPPPSSPSYPGSSSATEGTSSAAPPAGTGDLHPTDQPTRPRDSS